MGRKLIQNAAAVHSMGKVCCPLRRCPRPPPLLFVIVRGRNSGGSAALPRPTGRDPRRLTPLSNPSADLPPLSPARPVAGPAALRAPGITILSVILILVLAATEAARRGPWLDEF